ncbi:hypothetical protein RGQ29_028162 [Quercus rubra]|uniref:Reverse transcriptase zinc-binding domain-containing protein n=1 Tax=Quercus rubra TaxID=3512 RepID=A0AAN7ERD4_QUERU|nr:hypothetical protein RGQ29_028162 [Quercus rubra]
MDVMFRYHLHAISLNYMTVTFQIFKLSSNQKIGSFHRNESLPTRTKLFDRKISNSFSGALCNDEAETNSHLFLECSFAQSVWLQTQFWNGLQLPQPISFIDAMEAALKNLNSADFDTLSITCWMIWNCRNKLIFENKTASSKDLRARAELHRLELMEVQQKQNQVAEVQKMKWQPPNSDSIHKLNLAISQSKKNTSVGFGFLIRNNKGE